MGFKKFNLDPRIQAGIDAAGFVTPTPVQTEAIPAVLSGKDIIATAQTGTGKTAAFVLPILHRLLTGTRGHRTRVLIVTPTRELAEQIRDMIGQLGTGTGIRCATVYGGVGAAPQIEALRRGVDIIVACPGRMLDHLENNGADLSGVEVLVLDEADRMLDMGFLPSVEKLIKHLPAKRQTLLFSATFPSEIDALADTHLKHPTRVTLGLRKPVHTVAHMVYPVAQHLKTKLMFTLLRQTETGSVLIFTRTKHRAQRLAQNLERDGYKVTSLHSNRTQNQRQAALDGFRDGRYRIMVATDIAARGIDVENISHVINFDMPDTADAYIHRIGRTGRMERAGDAFTFITPEDHAMVRILERIMGAPLKRATFEGFDYGAAAPPRLPGSDDRSHHDRNRSHDRSRGGDRGHRRPSSGGQGSHRPSPARHAAPAASAGPAAAKPASAHPPRPADHAHHAAAKPEHARAPHADHAPRPAPASHAPKHHPPKPHPPKAGHDKEKPAHGPSIDDLSAIFD
ncbi:MAG: DEAD/DEAH box helicase [Planctomycetota bacterium]